MIHIVFSEADVQVLQAAQNLDDSLVGEIVVMRDDYSVGPIEDLYSGGGYESRQDWWRQIYEGSDMEGKIEAGEVDDRQTMANVVGPMRRNEEEQVWVWAAQNQHDVCGYFFVLHYLKEFAGRVYILYLNNLPFFNEKGGIFFPSWLSEIPAKEFLKAKKLAREITMSEWEIDPDQWQKIISEAKGVRILEGGKKITQHDYDYFDVELRKFVTADWQKVSKVLQHFASKSKEATGDAYLFWRLKTLAAFGLYDVQGDEKTMKTMEIKLKAE